VKRGDAALALLSISSSKSGIDRLLWVMAPDKLTHVPG
jgi:RNA polymerase sigma-70 factor, ECF subfamily